jgi:arylsulfatase A-like enzyme
MHFNRGAFHTEYDQWVKRVQPDGAGGVAGCGVMNNDWTARPWHMDEAFHHTNWTVNEALEFMDRRDPTCPFFLTVSFLAAHPPLSPPACYFERYIRTGVPDRWIGDWAVPPTPAERFAGQDPCKVDLKGEALLSARAGYYGLINHLDDQLNRLFNRVDGIETETGGNLVVIFCSDHGEMLGDHYFWRKQQPYEGSARIPFLVRGPESLGLRRNQTVDAPVCLEDIMPTVLDMAGVACPAGVDGKSLLPLLRGATEPVRPYLHLLYENAWDCLTDGKEKYVRHVDGREQMFDLRSDPGECRDRVCDAGLAGRVAAWRGEMDRVLVGKGPFVC